MAFAFVQSNDFSNNTSDTTISVSLTGVTGGNLIVVWVTHEGGLTTSIVVDDGTANITSGTPNDPGPHGQFSYDLSCRSGSRTYTATFGVSVAFRKIIVAEFSYTGVASLDVQDATQSANNASLVTGAITTTGTNELVIAAGRASGSLNYSAMQINSVNADGSMTPAAGGDAMWYRILSATFSSGTGTASLSGGGNAWIGNIIAFKAEVPPDPLMGAMLSG